MQNVKVEKGTVSIARGADKSQDARPRLLRAPLLEETFIREIQRNTAQRRPTALTACDVQPQRGSGVGRACGAPGEPVTPSHSFPRKLTAILSP